MVNPRRFVTGAYSQADSAAIGADTVTHTAPSATYRNGRVYRLNLSGRLGGEAGGCTAMALHFRKGTTT